MSERTSSGSTLKIAFSRGGCKSKKKKQRIKHLDLSKMLHQISYIGILFKIEKYIKSTHRWIMSTECQDRSWQAGQALSNSVSLEARKPIHTVTKNMNTFIHRWNTIRQHTPKKTSGGKPLTETDKENWTTINRWWRNLTLQIRLLGRTLSKTAVLRNSILPV